MFELTVLVAQTVAIFFLAAWLSTGLYENVFLPDLNETFTAQVLGMDRMREEYPEAYALVEHRRIENPRLRLNLFKLIVAWEGLATVALWIGFVAMLFAVLGVAAVETGRAFALFGALMFTSTWAGFLVVGNWFCYWFCHEGAQNTHYQMTLWGIGTLVFLVAA